MAAEDKAQLGPVAGGGSAAVDVTAKSSEDLSMIAWQKAFDAFAADLKLNELDHWVARLIGEDAGRLMLSANASAKDRLTQWVKDEDIDTRLSACRSQIGTFQQNHLEQKPLEHRLILLLAIHALMQVEGLVDLNQTLRCPESMAQVQDYEVAIAIVAHLYYGQGCVLELRGGRWRVANMIRTDALELMEADPTRNGNIMRIEREVQSLIKRAQPGLRKPVRDMARFKSDHGGMPFVLDVQKALDAQVCADLSQQLNLKVVPVGSNDTQHVQTVMDQVHLELVDLFSAAQHAHQTKEEETMKANSVKIELNNMGSGTINLGAAGIGDKTQLNVIQTINHGSPEKLKEFLEAMQAIQGMLKDESKKQEIQDVIEIVQKKEDNPTAKRSLSRMMAWLKGGAEKMVLVTDTIDAADKVKTQATVAAAALVQYWPMVQSLLA